MPDVKHPVQLRPMESADQPDDLVIRKLLQLCSQGICAGVSQLRTRQRIVKGTEHIYSTCTSGFSTKAEPPLHAADFW